MIRSNKKIIIGLTGNSGSGKTTAAEILREFGAHAIDADKSVHRLMEPGQAAYNEIAETFGDEILEAPSAPIDRKKLAAIVFNDTEKRTKLEAIIHPIVCADILTEAKASEADIVVIDAVLLVESGLHHHCDAVWLITAAEEERLKRIIKRDQITQEAAEARMRNQRNTDYIKSIAQAVIENNGDQANLKSQIKKILDKLMGSGDESPAGFGAAPQGLEESK